MEQNEGDKELSRWIFSESGNEIGGRIRRVSAIKRILHHQLRDKDSARRRLGQSENIIHERKEGFAGEFPASLWRLGRDSSNSAKNEEANQVNQRNSYR